MNLGLQRLELAVHLRPVRGSDCGVCRDGDDASCRIIGGVGPDKPPGAPEATGVIVEDLFDFLNARLQVCDPEIGVIMLVLALFMAGGGKGNILQPI